MHVAGALATAYLAAAGLWTANDPFVGKWKLDVARSVLVDRMEIAAAGPNRYTFKFEGGPAETVVADGSDQPGVQGTTLAVTAPDARTATVVRRQAGKVIVSAAWKVSDDGRTLRDDFTQAQGDGTSPTTHYIYQRMSGRTGFLGAWESTTPPVGLQYELQIQPYGDAGLSFVRPSGVKSVPFDGQDHAVAGAQGQTASGRRQGERAMEVTDKVAGQGLDTQAYEVSRDGRTLTMNIHRTGQVTPDRLVFERE